MIKKRNVFNKLKNNTTYWIDVLKTSVQFRLQKWGIVKSEIFKN